MDAKFNQFKFNLDKSYFSEYNYVDYFYNTRRHCWHIVDNSPWPFLTGISLLFLLSGIFCVMHKIINGYILLLVGLILVICVVILWGKDCIRESYQGFHTEKVQNGFYMGYMLIILTEVMLFFGIIWSLLFFALVPIPTLGLIWPPAGFASGFIISYIGIPLMNTTVLISSGVTITWAQFSLLEGNRESARLGLSLTLFLALIFLVCQWFEYSYALFSISDGIYGSIFYILTGLHGSHVILGMVLIYVSWLRLGWYGYTKKKHLGFIFSAWYWHFVDIVWLFLYFFLYLLDGNFFYDILHLF
jgi:cytochrome c oxidase subunit 3